MEKSGAIFEILGREQLPVPSLARLYADIGSHPGFVAATIRALGQLDSETAHRAAWLLRKCAAASPLSEAELGRVVELADASEHWIYRLTLCQLFAETGCPAPLREALFPFLRRCFDDRRVIIRAWALTAMGRFGNDSRYRKAIALCLRQARKDPAKSMQARLRHIEDRMRA